MKAAFDSKLDEHHGATARARFVVTSVFALLIDAAVQRLWTLGSHRRSADDGHRTSALCDRRIWARGSGFIRRAVLMSIESAADLAGM